MCRRLRTPRGPSPQILRPPPPPQAESAPLHPSQRTALPRDAWAPAAHSYRRTNLGRPAGFRPRSNSGRAAHVGHRTYFGHWTYVGPWTYFGPWTDFGHSTYFGPWTYFEPRSASALPLGLRAGALRSQSPPGLGYHPPPVSRRWRPLRVATRERLQRHHSEHGAPPTKIIKTRKLSTMCFVE